MSCDSKPDFRFLRGGLGGAPDSEGNFWGGPKSKRSNGLVMICTRDGNVQRLAQPVSHCRSLPVKPR